MRLPFPARAAVLAALACIAAGLRPAAAAAQEAPAAAPPSKEELARKLANPVADLVSIPVQFNWENGVGPDGDGLRTVINFQPVVPVSLSSRWNLIGRWVLPYISQPEAFGSVSGFGDVLLSAFLSPKDGGSLVWGVGPVLALPMSTSPALGTGKWSVGPTAVVIKLAGKWTYGFLANQLWSFADASSADRRAVSQAFLQPFVAYVTPGGVTFTLQSETIANWNADDAGDRWTVPINASVAKLTKLGPFPFSIAAGAGVFVASPEGGPSWKLRTVFAVLLPSK
jgi:hypothetical protein